MWATLRINWCSVQELHNKYGLPEPFMLANGSYDNGIYLIKGRWRTAGLWIERFKFWGPSRCQPSPSAIAAKTCWRTCIWEKLHILGVSDEVIVEEWNSDPRGQKMMPQAHFHFACIVRDDSIMERGDGCTFGQKVGEEEFPLWNKVDDIIEMAKEGQQLQFGASVCQKIVKQEHRDAWKDFESRVMPNNSMEMLGPEVFRLERRTQSWKLL